jgi:hypothetical protein
MRKFASSLINAIVRFFRPGMKTQPPKRVARPGERWTVTVPKEKFDKLKSDPEFCSMLALGRAVNALHFVHTPLLKDDDGSPRASRDRYNSLLFTCALFAEATLLVEKIEKKYFKGHSAFQRVLDVICGTEAKTLRKKLFTLRNTLVFHFDADQVQDQVKTLELQNPILVTGLGTEKLNTHHELADLVALRSFFGQDFPGNLPKIRPALQSVSKLVVAFLVAAEDFMVAIFNERGWAQINFL